MRPLLLLCLLALTLACPDNCFDCDPSFENVCFVCKEGFQLNVMGQCVDENIVPNCVLYGPTNQCFACMATFTLQGQRCVKEYGGCLQTDPADETKCTYCGFNLVLDQPSNKCVGAINCAQRERTCTSCLPGFRLDGSRCVDNTGRCLKQAANGICQTCNRGFKLIGYTCLPADQSVYGCYVYDGEGICDLCKGGYNLYDGYCLLPAQIQQIEQGIVSLEEIVNRKHSQAVVTTTTTTTITTTTGQKDGGFDGFGGGSSSTGGFGNFGNTGGFGGFGPATTPATPAPTPAAPRVVEPSSIFCDAYNLQTGICLTCRYGFTLRNGDCIDPNCQAQTGQGCTRCRQSFAVNTLNYCQYRDSNCRRPSATRCQQCVVGFFISFDGMCVRLPANCRFANIQTFACLQCDQGFISSNGQCVQRSAPAPTPAAPIANCAVQQENTCSQCNPRFQLVNNQCLRLPQNCLQLNVANPNLCIACATEFILSNGNCVRPQLPSTPNCASYNLATGVCTGCNAGFQLNQGACILIQGSSSSSSGGSSSGSLGITTTTGTAQVVVDRDPNCARYTGQVCSQCSTRYYFGSDRRCIPVNPLCNQFNAQGGCTSCYPGYTLSGTTCIVARVQDPFCRTYNQGGVCTACYSGYFYNQARTSCQPLNPLCRSSNITDGSCTACFPGYSLNAGICAVSFKDPNCKKFSQANANLCVQCAINFFIDPQGRCRQISPLCKTANQQNGACLSCYPGYVLQGTTCVVGGASNTDTNCKKFENGACTQCFQGRFLNAQGVCTAFNPLCRTSNQQNGACLTCFPGYVLAGGNCAISAASTTSGDPNCKKTDANNICQECFQGYYLTLGKSCQRLDPLCKTYTSNQAACASCYDGYVLVQGQCVIAAQAPAQNTDTFCIKSQGPRCIQCAAGYYLPSTGVCRALNPLCRTSDMSNGACLSCYPGYQILNTDCIVAAAITIPFCQTVNGNVCALCINGYFTKDGGCALANTLCSSYDPMNGRCLSCISGFVFQENECIFPSLGIDANCAFYTNSFCSRCLQGFALINYLCGPIDAKCRKFDQATNSCQSCSQGVPMGPSCV